MSHDNVYMRFALDLAKATLGQTSPNPVVGAVLVKNNSIVGFGAHLKAGDPHAEVHAISMAGDTNTNDATLYVTLEPCCHYGRTSPCTKLIIQKKISRVVIAALDPNHLVCGQGVAQLKEHDIEVIVGVLEQEAQEINQVFFHYIMTKRPYVTLKSGISLDAKLSTNTKQSKWITNSKARFDAHEYRSRHDAILVGVDTIIEDDPSLTVTNGKNPIRIVLDTMLRTPLNAKILNDNLSQTWLVTGCNVDENKFELYNNSKVQIIAMLDDKIDIESLLITLGQKGISSVFVEGGSKVITSFIYAKLFNQIILYISPILIGGINSLFSNMGFNSLDEAIKLDFQSIEKIDDNLKIVALRKE